MILKRLSYDLTVCKVRDIRDINLGADIFFIGKTDEEISLVCRTEDTPDETTEREDEWKGFRIEGQPLTLIISSLNLKTLIEL